MTAMGCLQGYGARWHWSSEPLGAEYTYSNFGAGWNAYVVEARSGVDFDTFTRDRIFDPIGMTHTAWFGNQLTGPLAEGYLTNRVTPTDEYGVNPYPSGNLRASARDVAKFLIVWTSEGVAENGTRILNASTIADALILRHPTVSPYGFGWAQGETDDRARDVWGHGGALGGVTTRVNIDPVNRDGFVMLLNGPNYVVGDAMNRIENRAFRVLAER